ncbi:Unknown protein sequence [Pseudomonas syringae pv. maculicola]|nr:Unknown protein sequence [Pseudomonas syringae pv. maculicola]
MRRGCLQRYSLFFYSIAQRGQIDHVTATSDIITPVDVIA